jgi:hypothetical protein
MNLQIKILSFVITFIASLLIIFAVSQKKYVTQTNNSMNLIQVSLPESDLLFELYDSKSPIIFQQEIEDWDGINSLLGRGYQEISNIIQENKKDSLEIIKGYLQFHQPLLSMQWNINFQEIVYTFNSPIYIVQEMNYLHLIANITGEIRIILIPPNEHEKLGKFSNNVSENYLTGLLNQENPNFEFIEIIVRQGNMIYIPYLWHYFIYKAEFEGKDNQTTILNMINKSWLNLI